VASGRIAAFDHGGEQVVDSDVACVAEFRRGLVVRACSFVSVDDALAWVSARRLGEYEMPPADKPLIRGTGWKPIKSRIAPGRRALIRPKSHCELAVPGQGRRFTEIAGVR